MKDFFKKLNKNQADTDDLDAGYDNEYYQGAYDRRDDRYDDRRDDRGRDERRDERRDDRYDDRYDDRRDDRAAVEEKPAETVFEPDPAPEYLYFTPATYSDCREGIARGLAAGHVVVVHLGGLEANDVLRLFDYMMGAVTALEAELVRPQATTVVLLPSGVELDENILELDDDIDEDAEEEDYEDEEYDDEYDDEDDGYANGEYGGYDEDYEEESDEDAE